MDDNQTDDQFLVNNPDDTNPIEDMKQDQELPEDNATPFSAPAGVEDKIEDTAQATDSNIDETERYQAGLQEAASVDPPSGVNNAEDDQDLELV